MLRTRAKHLLHSPDCYFDVERCRRDEDKVHQYKAPLYSYTML